MSRVAKKPDRPAEGRRAARSRPTRSRVKGPKGTLVDAEARRRRRRRRTTAKCSSSAEMPRDTKMAGTARALIANMVKGVVRGLSKQARAGRRRLPRRDAGQGSEPDARLLAPGRVQGAGRHHHRPVPTQTEIVINGADKQRVGEVAAKIRASVRRSPTRARACVTPARDHP